MKLTQSLRNALKTLDKGSCNQEEAFATTLTLQNLELMGLAVEIQGVWHITNAGRMAIMEVPPSKGVGNRQNLAEREVYKGEDWKSKVTREGALDYMKWKSKFSGSVV
jgi:hypothetical protein